jgi:cytochrome P450
VLEIAEQRRVEPKDDLLTHLVQAEVDGEPLNPLQLLALMFTLIGGGIDTTANAIGSAIVHLGRDRELRQRLIENPSLMPHAVEEFFRMWPPFHALARYVKQDCEIGGQPIKAGERILFVLGAANRDENEFERAQTVDIDRQPNRHLTFGTGVHRCIGSNYARSELHIALTRLLARLPNYQLLEEGVELQTDIGMVYGYRSIRAELCPVG